MSNVVLTTGELPKQQRVLRKPKHTFRLKTRPYQIQPFCIAPVLSGETMDSAFLQARVMTDPLRDQLLGWNLEYYLFYVKLTDLAPKSTLIEMLLDPDADVSSLNSAARPYNFHQGGIDYVKYCSDVVVEHYFRDDEDTGTKLNDLHQAYVGQPNILQSARKAQTSTDDVGADIDIPDYLDDAAMQARYTAWQQMQRIGLKKTTYEDYIGRFGVDVDKDEKAEQSIPELVRYVKNFTYPSTAVSGDGTSSSRAIWNVAEKVDKKRFFKEPGFLFGVTVQRPKVYMHNLRGAGVHAMKDAFSWMPADLSEQVYTTIRKMNVTTEDKILPTTFTGDYYVDVKDLLIYGDQFLNYPLTADDTGHVTLPTSALEKRYASSADINKFFADITVANTVTDGIVQFNIKGTQQDTSA